jgi:hypothetical protein
MGLLVNQAALSQPQQLPQLKQAGEMHGRTVVLETGDTKSASFFRKSATAFGAFVVASAKFIFKTALFLTGITPLMYITKFFWNCLNPKTEASTNKELAIKENQQPSKIATVSEEDINELCTELNSCHVSEDESEIGAPVVDLRSEDNINEELHAEIKNAMERVEALSNSTATSSVEPPVATENTESSTPQASVNSNTSPRRSTRVSKPTVRYGF